MAKRIRKASARKWEPAPGDAINLATIRWFALMVEAKAIEIYGTNPSVYPELQKVLAKCLGEVAAVNVEKEIAGAGDCPPGWVPCGEDCAPVCMEE